MAEDYNLMQANIGLYSNSTESLGPPTPTPSAVASQLTAAAQQRESVAIRTLSTAGVFGNEFRAKYASIQQEQIHNPIIADSLAGSEAQSAGYMPSPLSMTPANTGVFRPPSPAAISPISSIPQQALGVIPSMPLPSPMFKSPYEQATMLMEAQSRHYNSMRVMAPSAIAEGLTTGAGALLGAKIGSRMGPIGTAVGAGIGAAATYMSGITAGAGSVADWFNRGTIKQQELTSSLVGSTQSFVTGGANLSVRGAGLSRSGSMQLATGMQHMVSESSFKQQTGDMFNLGDLNKIMQQGGQAGLFDMSQSVPQIKSKLRETARTIKEFMEMTGDPDITSVIQQMGRMHQFGMDSSDIRRAAQSMKSYAMAAGTSVDGLRQNGGMPGAMIFQQAGLTAGNGFSYGNYAMAGARQLVTGGGLDTRQLALLGGQSGIAQRDMQAQAAMGSMGLYAVSNMQYGVHGWDLNNSAVGSSAGGGVGMVNRSVSSVNKAIAQGGIGAMVSMPLMQSEIASRALSKLSPQEQMEQRFKMALNTGATLGFDDPGQSFDAGARMLFGDDVARQMHYQARSKGFMREQQRQVARQIRQERHGEYARTGAAAGHGIITSAIDTISGVLSGTSYVSDSIKDNLMDPFRGYDPIEGIQDFFGSRKALENGDIYRNHGEDAGAVMSGLRASLIQKKGTVKLSKVHENAMLAKMDKSLKGKSFAKEELSSSEMWKIYERSLQNSSGPTSALGYLREAAPWMASMPATFADMGISMLSGVSPLEEGTAKLFGFGSWIQSKIAPDTYKSEVVDAYEHAVAGAQLTQKTSMQASLLDKEGYKGVRSAIEEQTDESISPFLLSNVGDRLDGILKHKSEGTPLEAQDYEQALTATLAAQYRRRGEPASTANAKAAKEAKSMLAGENGDKIRAGIYGKGKSNSSKKGYWLRSELESSKLLAEIGVKGSGIKAVYENATFKRLQKMAGWEGSGKDGVQFSDNERSLHALANNIGADKFAMFGAFAMDSGDDKERMLESMLATVRDEDGNLLTRDKLEKIQKEYKVWARENVNASKELGRGARRIGTVAGLQTAGAGMVKVGEEEALSNVGFKRLIGQGSDNALAYLSSGKVHSTSGLASSFSEEDIVDMENSDNKQLKHLAKAVKAAKAGDTSLLKNIGITESTISDTGKEITAGTVAGTKTEQQLNKAAGAIASMQGIADTFKPVVADFEKATTVFKEAADAALARERL